MPRHHQRDVQLLLQRIPHSNTLAWWQIGCIGIGTKVLIQWHTTVWVLVPKHIDNQAPRHGIQVMWTIESSSSPVSYHLDGCTDLTPKYHVVVLARKRGGIVPTLGIHSPPATTRVEVCFLDFLHHRDIPCCIPGIKPIPDDQFDIVKSDDSMDVA
jgi:hypothetical protein